MLTKEQIAGLRAWADVAVDDCEHDAKAYDAWNPGFPLPGQTQRKIRDEWVLIGQALAAYERVAALAADMRAKADRDLSGTHTHFANLIDRALEG